MKVSKEAIKKAEAKVEEAASIKFCVEQDICPKCSYGLELLEVLIPPIYMPAYTVRKLKCASLKCDFTYDQLV